MFNSKIHGSLQFIVNYFNKLNIYKYIVYFDYFYFKIIVKLIIIKNMQFIPQLVD